MIECPFCTASLQVSVRPEQRAVLSVCASCLNPVVLKCDGVSWSATPPRGVQDIRQTAQAGSLGARFLQGLPESIDRLPVLPEISQRFMALTRDPEASMEKLVRLINEDQVIALKILKLANSATYGGLTQIKDLRAACARLGVRAIANTVHAIAHGRLYTTKTPRFRKLMTDLWRHSLASAHCANQIAILTAEPNPDVLFVAGLTHDIGQVLLLDIVANHDGDKLSELRDAPELLEEIVKGYHSLLGLHTVHHWNLPPEFGISAYCHTHIQALPDDSWLNFVHTVYLASAIADASGYGTGPYEEISLLSSPSAKHLGMTDIKLASIRVDLEDKLAPLFEVASPEAA